MPGRNFVGANGYRYGFNGKENDNEVKGNGNQQDYGLRIYDPRLGRFLSLDPLATEYPELSPYQYANNNPITLIDIDGAAGGVPGPPQTRINISSYNRIPPAGYSINNMYRPVKLPSGAPVNGGAANQLYSFEGATYNNNSTSRPTGPSVIEPQITINNPFTYAIRIQQAITSDELKSFVHNAVATFELDITTLNAQNFNSKEIQTKLKFNDPKTQAQFNSITKVYDEKVGSAKAKWGVGTPPDITQYDLKTTSGAQDYKGAMAGYNFRLGMANAEAGKSPTEIIINLIKSLPKSAVTTSSKSTTNAEIRQSDANH